MKDKEKEEIRISEVKPMENTLKESDDIFSATEIKIEEMAIDGICGVY